MPVSKRLSRSRMTFAKLVATATSVSPAFAPGGENIIRLVRMIATCGPHRWPNARRSRLKYPEDWSDSRQVPVDIAGNLSKSPRLSKRCCGPSQGRASGTGLSSGLLGIGSHLVPTIPSMAGGLPGSQLLERSLARLAPPRRDASNDDSRGPISGAAPLALPLRRTRTNRSVVPCPWPPPGVEPAYDISSRAIGPRLGAAPFPTAAPVWRRSGIPPTLCVRSNLVEAELTGE